MYVVALVRLGSAPADEAKHLSRELGLAPYEATQLLLRGTPTITLRTNDRREAELHLANLSRRGHEAVGFDASAVVLDRASCDPLYRKALRVSVGASCRVPFAFVDSEAELVDALVDAGFTPYALSPRGAEDLRDVRVDALPDRVALVCGAEGAGLSEVTLARVRGLRMTMAEGWDSLNVSVAAGIALHAMSRAPVRSRTT